MDRRQTGSNDVRQAWLSVKGIQWLFSTVAVLNLQVLLWQLTENLKAANFFLRNKYSMICYRNFQPSLEAESLLRSFKSCQFVPFLSHINPIQISPSITVFHFRMLSRLFLNHPSTLLPSCFTTKSWWASLS